MKQSIGTLIFAVAMIFFVSAGTVGAQQRGHVSVPDTLTRVAIDAPVIPPPFAFNMPQIRFGAQASGIESCIKVTITNVTNSPQVITQLFVDDEKNYSIPSPSQKMLPISVPPKKPFDLSLCFKPAKIGTYKTRLTLKTISDSIILPIDGKGMKPEDISKLPKNELTVIKPKKKGADWTFKLQLISPAKITLQLFDALGVMAVNLLNNDYKDEGTYEIPYSGLDRDKKKLTEGNYYLRCVIEDVARNQTTKFTKLIEIK